MAGRGGGGRKKGRKDGRDQFLGPCAHLHKRIDRSTGLSFSSSSQLFSLTTKCQESNTQFFIFYFQSKRIISKLHPGVFFCLVIF